MTRYLPLEQRVKTFCFQTRDVISEISDTFFYFSNYPIEIAENDEKMVEKSIALLYDRSSQSFTVDSARKKLFFL